MRESIGKKALRAVYDLMVAKLGPPQEHDIEKGGYELYETVLRDSFELAGSFKTTISPMAIVGSAWWVYTESEIAQIDINNVNPTCRGCSQFLVFTYAYMDWESSNRLKRSRAADT
jgi:hypothetical protein